MKQIILYDKSFAPTLNLDDVDELRANMGYIAGAFRDIDAQYVMTNNVAFAGMNTSPIFKQTSGMNSPRRSAPRLP